MTRRDRLRRDRVTRRDQPPVAALVTAPRRPPTAAASPSQSLISEGPGGRIALTRGRCAWTPPIAASVSAGARGAFSGATVSVPNVVDASPYSGIGREGATTRARWPGIARRFQRRTAGAYALSFQSANFRANVWLDGRTVASHTGSYLPFEVRAQLAAGTHTRRRARRLARPRRAGATQAFIARGSTGAGSTARSACARSAPAS